MIREKTQKEYIIDLTGPDGNAFALMGKEPFLNFSTYFLQISQMNGYIYNKW